MTEPRWLDDGEQATWRAYLLAGQLIEEALDRQLQRDAGMPHTYYGILTTLEEAGPEGMRMSELARTRHYSPSRLTHAITSLERSGWVERRQCPTDRRGQVAVITPQGSSAQHAAAPGHVAEVRRRLFDRLTPSQVDQLGEICRAVIAGFSAEGDPAADPGAAAPT